jgi:hypothetical protein
LDRAVPSEQPLLFLGDPEAVASGPPRVTRFFNADVF